MTRRLLLAALLAVAVAVAVAAPPAFAVAPPATQTAAKPVPGGKAAARGEKRKRSSGSSSSAPRNGAKKTTPDASRPVNITSQFFEVRPDTHEAHWRGNVVIERDDVRVNCDSMTATYDDAKRMDKLTCQGHVHMLQRANTSHPEREAWGALAVFENTTGVLTVSPGPEELEPNAPTERARDPRVRAREGVNKMSGTKVVFLVQEDRLQVENATIILEQSSVSDGGGAAPESPRPPTPGDGAGGGAK